MIKFANNFFKGSIVRKKGTELYLRDVLFIIVNRSEDIVIYFHTACSLFFLNLPLLRFMVPAICFGAMKTKKVTFVNKLILILLQSLLMSYFPDPRAVDAFTSTSPNKFSFEILKH